MKRSLGRDVLQERNPRNGLFRKGEFNGKKLGENELEMISSGGVFR